MRICAKTGRHCKCSSHLLLNCIENGNNGRAKSLLRDLESCADLVDFVHSNGRNLLHYSAEYDNPEIMQYLIEKGLDVDAQDKDGMTPLLLAVQNENIASVEILLNSDVDIYFPNLKKKGSLRYAVHRRINSSSLMCLEQPSHIILEMFFDKINKDFLTNTAETKRLLLTQVVSVQLIAIAIGGTNVAKFILESGFSTDYTDPHQGIGILEWIMIFAKVENAKVSIEHGANIYPIEHFSYCYTANFARVDENSTILKMWLKCAADNLTVSNQREPGRAKRELKNLLIRGNKETVRAVLESEIDVVSMKFNLGETFLHVLIENENTDVVELLDDLDIKFNVNAVDSDGETALMSATHSGYLKNVEFLLRRGAYVNLTSWNGTSILEATTFYKHLTDRPVMAKIITLLLNYGAKAQTVFSDGKSILDCLCSDDERTQVILGHLALLGLHDPQKLSALSRDKIESKTKLQTYFNLCTKQLEETKNISVHGTVTLFKLLVEADEQLVSYARNPELIVAFNCLMKRSSNLESYYFDTLENRITKALDQVELEQKVALVIEELTGLCSDMYHAIIYKIISYLSPKDLKDLLKLKKA